MSDPREPIIRFAMPLSGFPGSSHSRTFRWISMRASSWESSAQMDQARRRFVVPCWGCSLQWRDIFISSIVPVTNSAATIAPKSATSLRKESSIGISR